MLLPKQHHCVLHADRWLVLLLLLLLLLVVPVIHEALVWTLYPFLCIYGISSIPMGLPSLNDLHVVIRRMLMNQIRQYQQRLLVRLPWVPIPCHPMTWTM